MPVDPRMAAIIAASGFPDIPPEIGPAQLRQVLETTARNYEIAGQRNPASANPAAVARLRGALSQLAPLLPTAGAAAIGDPVEGGGPADEPWPGGRQPAPGSGGAPADQRPPVTYAGPPAQAAVASGSYQIRQPVEDAVLTPAPVTPPPTTVLPPVVPPFVQPITGDRPDIIGTVRGRNLSGVGGDLGQVTNFTDLVTGALPGTPAGTQPSLELRQLLVQAAQMEEAARVARFQAIDAAQRGDAAAALQAQQAADQYDIQRRQLTQNAEQFGATLGLSRDQLNVQLEQIRGGLRIQEAGVTGMFGGQQTLDAEMRRREAALRERQQGFSEESFLSNLAARPENLIQSALMQGARTPGGSLPTGGAPPAPGGYRPQDQIPTAGLSDMPSVPDAGQQPAPAVGLTNGPGGRPLRQEELDQYQAVFGRPLDQATIDEQVRRNLAPPGMRVPLAAGGPGRQTGQVLLPQEEGFLEQYRRRHGGAPSPPPHGFGARPPATLAGGQSAANPYLDQAVPVPGVVSALLQRSRVPQIGAAPATGFMTSLRNLRENPALRLSVSGTDLASSRNLMPQEQGFLNSVLQAQGQNPESFEAGLRRSLPRQRSVSVQRRFG